MEIFYPMIDEPATPEYILAVFQDMHRQQCQHDPEADPDAVLSFATTTAEWRNACDLLPTRELGRAQNSQWAIQCSDHEWRAALEPCHEKTLADVCAFIAGRTSQPRIRPARLFGRTCVSAGAFLTVRSLLHQAGALTEEITPSTQLAPYTRRYSDLFLGPISEIAPGTLPLVSIAHPVYDEATWGVLAGMLCLTIGVCCALPLLTIAGGLLFALCYAFHWLVVCHLLLARVTFGDLRTFRDLANAIAEGDRA